MELKKILKIAGLCIGCITLIASFVAFFAFVLNPGEE